MINLLGGSIQHSGILGEPIEDREKGGSDYTLVRHRTVGADSQ